MMAHIKHGSVMDILYRYDQRHPARRKLTDRQRAVMALIDRGHTARQAGLVLGLSAKQASDHLRAGRRKLDA